MLEPALGPSAYSSAEHFERERASVFAPAWHLVAAGGALGRPGGQVACEVMGEPVVVRNEGGRLTAFRNVCPHRHSLIVAPGESSAPTLRCQYHGWEFGSDGRLSRLPDGPSFRGFKARNACLEGYAVESLGPLVFVRLTAEGPSLREAFGAAYDTLRPCFEGAELFLQQRTEHDANWKVVVENAVESYHVPLVHPETFREYLAEEFHEHRLEETFSSYRPTAPPSSRERLAFAGFSLMGLGGRARRYQHVHVFPNLLVSLSGIYAELVAAVPLGPERTRREAYGFVPPVDGRNPVARALDLAHRHLTRRAADRLLVEDSGAWPGVQQGARHSRARGVLGAREERVFHFQRWVAARTAG